VESAFYGLQAAVLIFRALVGSSMTAVREVLGAESKKEQAPPSSRSRSRNLENL
jgi:hypothetical protein